MFLLWILWVIISILLPALQYPLDVPHAAAASIVRPVDGLKQGILAVVVQAVGETFQICRTRYRPDALLVDLDHLTEILVLGWCCSRRDMFTVYTVYVGFVFRTLGGCYGFVFRTLRVRFSNPWLCYGFVSRTLVIVHGFIFCTLGCIIVQLYEMVSRLHLVARVDGSDESLLLELAPGVDDGLFPSHPQLTHQLRICYFKPFGPL